jgi:hypothetical protein
VSLNAHFLPLVGNNSIGQHRCFATSEEILRFVDLFIQ